MKGFAGPLAAFFFADLGVERGQFDIFQGSGARKQVESLKDETDLAVADGRQLFLRQLGDRDAFEQVAAAGRLVQAAQNIHERGFAAAAGAHDGDKLAPLDADVDAAQGMHLGFAQIVVLVHVVDLNQAAASGFAGRLYCGLWNGRHRFVLAVFWRPGLLPCIHWQSLISPLGVVPPKPGARVAAELPATPPVINSSPSFS